MRNLLSFMKRKVLFTFLLSLLLLDAIAQTWSVGGYNNFHSRFVSTPLQIRSRGRASLLDFDFVSKVGGVSFDAVARPAAGTNLSSLKLVYNSEKPNGQRLKIIVNNISYTVTLPDWELIPIARYADSDNTACVTLFGEESTEKISHIKYHSAFTNNLLGLRLLQADIMFENIVDFSKVFKYQGRYKLGVGEVMPDEVTAREAVIEIANTLYRFGTRSFDSYVVTDAGVSVEFSTKNNQFSLTGTPYYFFFKYSLTNKIIESGLLTQALQRQYAQIRNMNPLVYDATTRTMRYAAFFRYVKKTYPAIWSSFLSSISNLKAPIVYTPTSMDKE